jgi:thioesterase-3
MCFESTFKIRTFHSDSFGHVHNARYLELLEEARWQFAEHLGLIEVLNEENLGFIIMQMNLRFRLPVVEGDTIQVLTSLISLGTAIGEVEQLIMKKGAGKLAATSTFHFALIDRTSGVSVPIAGKIRSLLSNVVQPKKGCCESPDPFGGTA